MAGVLKRKWRHPNREDCVKTEGEDNDLQVKDWDLRRYQTCWHLGHRLPWLWANKPLLFKTPKLCLWQAWQINMEAVRHKAVIVYGYLLENWLLHWCISLSLPQAHTHTFGMQSSFNISRDESFNFLLEVDNSLGLMVPLFGMQNFYWLSPLQSCTFLPPSAVFSALDTGLPVHFHWRTEPGCQLWAVEHLAAGTPAWGLRKVL